MRMKITLGIMYLVIPECFNRESKDFGPQTETFWGDNIRFIKLKLNRHINFIFLNKIQVGV